MTSTVRQIAYRLKSEGKAELLRDQREVADGFRGTYAAAEAGAAAATKATERQERRYRALAQAAREAEAAAQSQSRYNAVLGVGVAGAGSARDSADVFAAQAAAMEDGERRARALRSILDPLGAAQDRLNDELREYKALADAGKISTTELARAQQMARQKFDETAASVDRQSRGLSRLVLSSRLNLARQGADVAVTAAMGMNPAMIAIQQGPQILDAMATSGIRVSGAMAVAAGSAGLLATATGVLIAAWHSGEQGAMALERAVSGLGRTQGLTARELAAAAEEGARAGDISVRSAERQASAYLSTGKIGGEIITGLISIHRDYASVMGLEAEEATRSLAKAMVEPDKAARDLTRSIGLLDQKTLDHIDSLIKQGDRLAAQRVLVDALSDAVRGHADQVGQIESLWDAAARGISNYWHNLGTFLHVTRDERIEQLQGSLARNPSRGGNIGLRQRDERELRLLTTQRDIATMLAQGRSEEAAANQAAQEARDRADAAAAGNRAAGRRAEAEAARRAREAERQAREALQRSRREEDRETSVQSEVARLRNQEDVVQSLQDEVAIRTRIRELVDDGMADDLARDKANAEQARVIDARLEAAENEARLRAEMLEIQDAQERGDHAIAEALQDQIDRQAVLNDHLRIWKNDWLANLMTDLEMATAAERRADAIERAVELTRQERAINLSRLSGREDETRQLEIAQRVERRAREIEAGRDGRKLNRGEGMDQARREVREELDAEAEGVRRRWVRDFVDDIRRGGIREALAEQFERATDRLLDRLIDGLLEIDWGGLFKGGSGGGQSGGGGWGAWLSRGLEFLIGRNADGTDYWRGGLTWVGERGPELINAPRGSQIFDHGKSLRMVAANAGAGVMKVEVPVTLALPAGFVPERQLVALLQQAAEVGASEGAKRALGSMQGVQMQMQVHKGG